MSRQNNINRNICNHVLYMGFGGLLGFALLSGAVLASSRASANTSVIDDIAINVPVSCSMSGTIATGEEHEGTVSNGAYTTDIGITTLQAFCNDDDGFSIYAIGYTNNIEGTNTLIGSSTGLAINTGVYSSGDSASSWAMKLSKVTDTNKAFNPANLSIENSFDSYHAVPSTYTRVAKYEATTGSSATDKTLGSKIETTYAAYISGSQAADTYVGRVKYLLVHPSAISSISSSALTVNFTVPDGSDMSFSGGSTVNTVNFRQICTDSSDLDTCTFLITDGEYKEPINYKGAWVVTLPGGSAVYPIENEEQWYVGLAQLGGAGYLGFTMDVVAYDGQAIRYNGNGATGGDMSSVASRFTTTYDGNETTFASNTTTLIAPNFYKAGYGFAGWSTSSSAMANSGTIFGPNQTISTSDVSFDSDNTDTLYAVWVPTSGSMQTFSCSSLNSGEVTALTDTRDNNVYTVGKLADGQCWMMENLRLGGRTSLSASNTNSPVISSLGSSADNWCKDVNEECYNQSVLNVNNTNMNGANSNGVELMSSYYMGGTGIGDHVQWYGYGNYYNWYAATAGNGTYSVSSGSVSGDICPTGWSLPTGRTGGQFSSLDSAIGGTGSYQDAAEASNRWRTYPNNFVYSGYWNGSSAGNRSYDGYYWSRTAYSSDYACNLNFRSGGVDPENHANNKYGGFSVRCVAQ